MKDRVVYEDIDEKAIRSFRDTMEFNYERERLRLNFKEFLKAGIKAQEELEEIEKDLDKTYEIKRFKETKNEKEKNIEKLIIIDMSKYSDEELNKIAQRIQNEIIDEDIEIKIIEKISDVFLIPGRKIIK